MLYTISLNTLMDILINANVVNFNAHKVLSNVFNFKTEGSNNFKIELIAFAVLNVDRVHGFFKLCTYIDPLIADKLETGIFEFSLVKITFENIPFEFVTNIYAEKLNYICANIDVHNDRIKNTTMKSNLINGHINPYFVPFMSPEQVHPARWKTLLDKVSIIERENNNIRVTDIYKCFRCGNRKTKTSQMQTRSADEPMTIFVTCLVCYNTFSK